MQYFTVGSNFCESTTTFWMPAPTSECRLLPRIAFSLVWSCHTSQIPHRFRMNNAKIDRLRRPSTPDVQTKCINNGSNDHSAKRLSEHNKFIFLSSLCLTSGTRRPTNLKWEIELVWMWETKAESDILWCGSLFVKSQPVRTWSIIGSVFSCSYENSVSLAECHSVYFPVLRREEHAISGSVNSDAQGPAPQISE
jgi:hypothetical protein